MKPADKGAIAIVGTLAIALSVIGCGGDQTSANSSRTTEIASVATTSSVVAAQGPTTVSLPVLPPVGVAVETSEGVRLVDLTGTTLATLRQFKLTINWRPEQSVQVQNTDGVRLALDLRANALTPSSAPPPESRSSWPALPTPPAGSSTSVVGHWRWSLLSPDGETTLAQWSGECEVPMAFLIPQGGEPRAVIGDDWTTAPNSVALGWSPDGRAVVFVYGDPACGSGLTEGVYLVSLSGTKTLLAKGSEAQFWHS